MKGLYKYQDEGIKRLKDIVLQNQERAAMLCDPPGAGKTPQAIGLFQALEGKTALIVCPASLRENWRREFNKWTSKTMNTQILQSSSDVIRPDADILIVSFNLAIRMGESLSLRKYDLLIVDESHYLKSASSQAARIILILLWSRANYRLLMTGTPLPNGRAVEAWTTFSRCHAQAFGSWEKYKARYCVEERTRWGVTYPYSKNLDELKKLSQSFMVRRPKEEVLQQLPGLVRQNIYVTLPEGNIFDAEDGIDVDAIVEAVENGMPLESEHLSVVRRRLAMLKAPHILEHILETLEEVQQAVVFVHHRELYEHLFQTLREKELPVVGINGLTPAEERAHSVDIFQAGKARVFIASIKAANTGLTLTSASTLIMAEYDWVPSTNEQAEGRIFRVTQKEICRVRYIVAANSLDEKILKVVQRKQKQIDKAVGQDETT
jgi:SWI/SNF-related matrix-associated actin-dependent regulator 1 of chromatin subfamily A